MLKPARSRPAFVAVFVSLVSLLYAQAAIAGTPANVTVRVEGISETKLSSTLLTTTTTPVVKDGNSADSCPGTSALGALNTATTGNWGGPWEASLNQYAIFTIAGETHEFEEGASANYYWSFWLNNKEASVGACEAELESGDQVLFFPACYGASCPTPEPTPLEIEAPVTANLGENVPVTVKQYNSKGEASPAIGASVEGGGATATTDSQGHAILKLTDTGTDTLRVSAATSGPPAVRTETTICVHAGNDGTCGTTVPTKIVSTIPPGPTIVGTERPPVIPVMTVHVGGVREGHVYSRRHAPRVLSGKVISSVPVTSISIRLLRSYKDHCWAYNGARERLQHTRCGHGSYFKVSSGGSSFSYLLPAKLPPGRYQFDIEATNSTEGSATPRLDVSKIVFYVK
jgi:hypothetical protein